ncbi:MAG: nucleoid-associated protein [Akkermansiaceae bacterium]|nr:nucleoid-associated protein [Akkermansiaceae bacterium]MCF7733406.1 nucleoid-associated protein [Akkermansiaceae bacterium]
MSSRLRFSNAVVTQLVLAKVGHPQREEPLQMSKQAFVVAEADQEMLASLLLKPFKNLGAYRFSHHASLAQHELNTCSAALFETPAQLHATGSEIASRLYSKSNHPNIKSGDLCIALVEGIATEQETLSAICILKSESVVPFLSISDHDGDLHLHTEEGINPEKIDKGALILNRLPQKGYHVLTFDRTGSDSRFWVRDFLGVTPITDSPFLTNQYSDMAVAFVKQEEKARRQEQPEGDEAPPWDTAGAARDAMAYFESQEKFNLQEFEEKVLRTPEAAAKFAVHRAKVEDDLGQRFDSSFDISKKDLNKARKQLGSVMKLDTGVEIHLKPAFAKAAESLIEQGFDEERGMKYVKVFFNRNLA